MTRLGFVGESEDTTKRQEEILKEKIRKALEHHFRPEFLNRVDDIVVFNRLTPEIIIQIIDIQLQRFMERIGKKEIKVVFTPEAKKFLATSGYDQQYGARPLKRVIQSLVLNPLAEDIIAKRVFHGDSVTVDLKDAALVFLKNGKPLRSEKPARVPVLSKHE